MTKEERKEKNLILLDELSDFRNPLHFHFYFGEVKSGWLWQNGFEDYYIIAKREDLNSINNSSGETQLNILKEKGYKIIPETLETWSAKHHINQPPHIDTKFNHGGNKIKKLVIVGAGASYNFSPNPIEIFPLTNGIFSEKNNAYLNNFPGAKYYLDELSEESNLEQYFQEEWNSVTSSYDIHTLRKIINTQFFLHYLFFKKSKINQLTDKSYYRTLVSFLSKYCHRNDEKIAVINFNYDLMLEGAIEHYYNTKLDTINSYINNPTDILLFKPHGSCNWARKFKGNTSDSSRDIIYTAEWAYKNNKNLYEINEILENEVICLPDFYEHIASSAEQPVRTDQIFTYFPELLIPYSEKDNFVMPMQHTNALNNLLNGIDEILIIGWKGTENKFNNMLKNRIGNKHIKVTSFNSNDMSVTDNLSPYLVNADFEYNAEIYSNNPMRQFTDLARLIKSNKFKFS